MLPNMGCAEVRVPAHLRLEAGVQLVVPEVADEDPEDLAAAGRQVGAHCVAEVCEDAHSRQAHLRCVCVCVCVCRVCVCACLCCACARVCVCVCCVLTYLCARARMRACKPLLRR